MKRSLAGGSALFFLIAAVFASFAFSRSLAQVPPAAASESVPPVQGNSLAVFFSGQRRATLEPCGCHTRQQGGIPLEATAYKPFAAFPQLRLDAGEWASLLAARMPTEPLKTAFLLRGLRLLDFDAVNVSVSDVQMSSLWFADLRKAHPEALERLVSSNVYLKGSSTLAFNADRIVSRTLTNGTHITIAITGIAGLSNVSQIISPGQPAPTQSIQTISYEIRDPFTALAPFMEKYAGKADMLAVLYSGEIGDAIKIAKANPQLDLLVTTARNADPTVKYIREGRTVILINPMPQAKEIDMIHLMHQGKDWQTTGETVKLVVSKELPEDPTLAKLVSEYKDATHTIAAELPPADAPQTWAGEDKCITCHMQAHAQWMGTPHAHAMQTLVERNQQFNPDCVRCHVTGYKKDNGFWHITDAHSQLYMSNVQCEDCHGPAQQHVFDEQTKASGAEKWMPPPQFAKLKQSLAANMPKKQAPAAICTQCHTDVTDPDFDYGKMSVKINHTQPYKSEPGKDTTKMHGMPATAAKTLAPAAPVKS